MFTPESGDKNNQDQNDPIRRFKDGLGEAIRDITALEVNTIVVSSIAGLKFNPSLAYEALFDIPHEIPQEILEQALGNIAGEENANPENQTLLKTATTSPKKGSEAYYNLLCQCYDREPHCSNENYKHLTTLNLDEMVKDETNPQRRAEKKERLKASIRASQISHLKLRERLAQRAKLAIAKLMEANELTSNDRLTEIEKDRLMELQQKEPKLLTESEEGDLNVLIEKFNKMCELPRYHEFMPPKLTQLLGDQQFVAGLRKLNELRALIEKGEAADPDNVNDNIYAQTTIQIDGDTINSFNKRLFEEKTETRDFLIKVHQDAVNSGQENWHSLLKLIVKMLSEIPKLFPKL